jgi:hypothetical protein
VPVYSSEIYVLYHMSHMPPAAGLSIHTHRLSSVCWIRVKISPVHVTGLRGDGVQQEGKVMLTQVSCVQV